MHDRPKHAQRTSVRGRLLAAIKESPNVWYSEDDFIQMLTKAGKTYQGDLRICANNLRWAYPAIRGNIEVKDFKGKVWVRWSDNAKPATNPKAEVKAKLERLVAAYGDCQDILHEIAKQIGYMALAFGQIRVETNDIIETLNNN